MCARTHTCTHACAHTSSGARMEEQESESGCPSEKAWYHTQLFWDLSCVRSWNPHLEKRLGLQRGDYRSTAAKLHSNDLLSPPKGPTAIGADLREGTGVEDLYITSCCSAQRSPSGRGTKWPHRQNRQHDENRWCWQTFISGLPSPIQRWIWKESLPLTLQAQFRQLLRTPLAYHPDASGASHPSLFFTFLCTSFSLSFYSQVPGSQGS